MVSIQYLVAGSTASEISASIESGVRTGALRPGVPLPSVRALAADLEVAAGTVAAAYKSLRERGLLESRGRHGTYVRPHPPITARSAELPVPAGVVDLASGQPDPALLPRLGPVRAKLSPGPAGAPAALVLPELLGLGRERLAVDGVPADALTVTSGGLDAVHRVLTAQLHPGDIVAVEDPGWPNVLDLIAALGMHPRAMAMDEQGPRPEQLSRALRAGAQAVIVTTRAQNPTGAFVTRERQAELRAVLADHPQTLVIEDDHASELAGVPLAPLATVTDSWAFVRSTSKPYGPDLRLALLAGDETTMARVEGRMHVGTGWVSTLLQRLVVELWNSPHALAAIGHAASTYDSRRNQLIAELADRGIASTGRTGINVWIPVADETNAVTRLLQAGWAVAAGARFRQASQPAIRVTLSGLTPAAIRTFADDLAAAAAAVRPYSYTT
jgi:DNA-binding transcriptional MocR family regulator